MAAKTTQKKKKIVNKQKKQVRKTPKVKKITGAQVEKLIREGKETSLLVEILVSMAQRRYRRI